MRRGKEEMRIPLFYKGGEYKQRNGEVIKVVQRKGKFYALGEGFIDEIDYADLVDIIKGIYVTGIDC